MIPKELLVAHLMQYDEHVIALAIAKAQAITQLGADDVEKEWKTASEHMAKLNQAYQHGYADAIKDIENAKPKVANSLDKRIDILQVQIKSCKNMLSKYKNPKGLKKEIAYDEEILGFLLELQRLRKEVYQLHLENSLLKCDYSV